jgi:hypothetical protein
MVGKDHPNVVGRRSAPRCRPLPDMGCFDRDRRKRGTDAACPRLMNALVMGPRFPGVGARQPERRRDVGRAERSVGGPLGTGARRDPRRRAEEHAKPGSAPRKPDAPGAACDSPVHWALQSGWPDSNRRTSAPQTRRSNQAELHPALVRTSAQRDSSRTRSRTSRSLRGRAGGSRSAAGNRGRRACRSRAVHRGVVVAPAAVGARQRLLQRAVPRLELLVPAALLVLSPLANVRVVCRVAGLAARLATTAADRRAVTSGGTGRAPSRSRTAGTASSRRRRVRPPDVGDTPTPSPRSSAG